MEATRETPVSIGDREIPWQDTALDIWDRKYRLKSKTGKLIDSDMDATWHRVAAALSSLEATPELRETWYGRFVWALKKGAIPAGRIVSNAGAQKEKPATSTINCTVSGIVEDSMEGILDKVKEAGMTLRAGCGIGYEFSTLRPKGGFVAGAGACTSGPLSFMDIFDRMCFTISSAGGRRGAQMATFDVSHPDVFDFIEAKREDGRLRQFNLSLLITQDFMEAVCADADWPLVFPVKAAEVDAEQLDLHDPDQAIWRDWPVDDGYVQDKQGRTACRVHRKVRARELWDRIMRSTYDFAEPGFILIDEYNQMNNNWFGEEIRATNPCGEQGLPPYGSCLLGSVNLTRFVKHAFTERAVFDWETFREVVAVFTRMLDNVVEVNGLALPQQRDEIERKRRHGMGYLGLGSALTMLRVPYGSAGSIEFADRVTRELAVTGWKAALDLSREKGAAPILLEEFEVTEAMLAKRPEMRRDGFKPGDKVPGRILHARYSHYMQRLAEIEPELIDALADEGARFTHHSSIAPTGTISLSLANNASNGIEPSFAHHYVRNVIQEGCKTKQQMDVYSFELLAYRELIDPDADPKSLPDYFVAADDISPEAHIAVQGAAQRWIDSSISKTINVPTDYPFDQFKDIYVRAWQHGLKGCTTFRYNPEAFQGVLVRQEDLAATSYRFTLEDGSSFEATGDEQIEYDGEVHSAGNLYEAFKEGFYGKL